MRSALKPHLPRIPVKAAKAIAHEYDCHQVIVIARKVDGLEPGVEHCVTYGVDKENCAVAARIGDFLKYHVMQWPDKRRGQEAKLTEVLMDILYCQTFGERTYQDAPRTVRGDAEKQRHEAMVALYLNNVMFRAKVDRGVSAVLDALRTKS